MIWIVDEDRSFQVLGTNISKEANGNYALWVQRAGQSSFKLIEGDEAFIKENKEAIDFAVKGGFKTYEIKRG